MSTHREDLEEGSPLIEEEEIRSATPKPVSVCPLLVSALVIFGATSLLALSSGVATYTSVQFADKHKDGFLPLFFVMAQIVASLPMVLISLLFRQFSKKNYTNPTPTGAGKQFTEKLRRRRWVPIIVVSAFQVIAEIASMVIKLTNISDSLIYLFVALTVPLTSFAVRSWNEKWKLSYLADRTKWTRAKFPIDSCVDVFVGVVAIVVVLLGVFWIAPFVIYWLYLVLIGVSVLDSVAAVFGHYYTFDFSCKDTDIWDFNLFVAFVQAFLWMLAVIVVGLIGIDGVPSLAEFRVLFGQCDDCVSTFFIVLGGAIVSDVLALLIAAKLHPNHVNIGVILGTFVPFLIQGGLNRSQTGVLILLSILLLIAGVVQRPPKKTREVSASPPNSSGTTEVGTPTSGGSPPVGA